MAPSRRSLLAEMAWRFVEQREVLATASLGYILHSSSIARDALRTWLAERGVMIPPDVGYRAEVVEADQEGRPDVVGAVGDKVSPGEVVEDLGGHGRLSIRAAPPPAGGGSGLP